MRRSSWVAVLALVLGACEGVAPEIGVVRDAAKAMGGVGAVQGARTVILDGTGTSYRLGQSTSPDADPPTYDVESYRKVIDLANHRWRMTQVRSGNFLTSTPVASQVLIQSLDGDVAYDTEPGREDVRLPARVALDRRAEFYHYPLALLQAALADSSTATVSDLRQLDGDEVVDVTLADGMRFTLYIDPGTDLPTRIESLAADPILGDVTIATTFSDWTEAGSLRLPRSISETLDRYPEGEYHVLTRVNTEIPDLAAGPKVREAPEPVPQPVEVGVQKLADGVWFLSAGYNSVLVEFPTYTALIEAPESEARTLAVFAKVKELVPGKPLRYLLNTHFHFDHSAGVRAAVAEGLTLLTHEIHRSFFEDLVSRPHTLSPDLLAKHPQPLSIETVVGDGPYELEDGARKLVVYRLKEDVHADGMLMFYLPRERILVEADAFSPGATAFPFAANLLAQVRTLGLDVDRIAPIHGRVVPFEQLQRVVAMITRPSRPGG